MLEGRNAVGEKWEKKSNTHGILELVTHTVRALGSARHSDTRKFENRNKRSKKCCKGSKSGQGGMGGELNAMKWERRVLGFVAAILGAEWGPNGEFHLGTELIGMRDTKEGREHLPHPCLAAHTRLLRSLKPAGRLGLSSLQAEVSWMSWITGDWVPDVMGKSSPKKNSDEYFELVKGAVKAHNIYHDGEDEIVDGDITELKLISSLRNDSTHRTFFVSTGDHVSVWWDGVKHYCCIDRVVGVVVGGKGHVWVIPGWYEHHREGGPDGTAKIHQVRGTQMIVKSLAQERAEREGTVPWIPAKDISDQVLIKHSCVHTPTVQKRCEILTFCMAHKRVSAACDGCSVGSPTYRAYYCNPLNKDYEILDKAAGFVSRTQLALLEEE